MASRQEDMTKLRDVTKVKPHDYDTHMYVSLSVHRVRKNEGEALGQCEGVSGHGEEAREGYLQAASRTNPRQPAVSLQT